MYKIGSPKIAALPFYNSSFMEVFMDIRTLGFFYGTDVDGTRNDFNPAFKQALIERIGIPILHWKDKPKSCFFKPFADKKEGVHALAFGLVVPLLTLVVGLGVALSAFSLPTLIVFFTLPAFIELVAGIVSLCQAALHQLRAIHYRENEFVSEQAQELAKSYLLDSGIHFALVLPMMLITLLTTPFELVRVVTRSIATLVDYISPKKLESNEEPEDFETGHHAAVLR